MFCLVILLRRNRNLTMMRKIIYAVTVLIGLSSGNAILHDYGDALAKSILFFEGQRSGKLPATQRLTWRRDSALGDGLDKGVSVIYSTS